jgi:quercetin dioxygenase-like cupin family protein
MAYRIFDASIVEERRKPVRSALAVTAFGLNQFDNQPRQAGKAHDEVATGQEEVYIPLAGRGVLRIGGEEVSLAPGRYVAVSPEEVRQVVAGDEGLSYLVVGGRPGSFEPMGSDR